MDQISVSIYYFQAVILTLQQALFSRYSKPQQRCFVNIKASNLTLQLATLAVHHFSCRISYITDLKFSGTCQSAAFPTELPVY